MKYNPPVDNALMIITYGSRLYGTDTPTSDFDFKVISLPAYSSMLLGKALQVERFRFDAEGNTVGNSTTMPDNGYEAEHTPVQKFISDYLTGQAYAVEMVYAVLQGAHLSHLDPHNAQQGERFFDFTTLCKVLADKFAHRNVQGMVGFAMKQTFDYVRRGERLNSARALLAHVDSLDFGPFETLHGRSPRLDDTRQGAKCIVLEELAALAGLEMGTTINNNKELRTLKLNGREYTETTSVPHFYVAVKKLVDSYGDRSSAAAETDVDWKSLSHAVRVYQQVIELLTTKWITFPRPNAAELLEIKLGNRSLEEVKVMLQRLDDEVQALVASSVLPQVTFEFKQEVDEVLFTWVNEQYRLLNES